MRALGTNTGLNTPKRCIDSLVRFVCANVFPACTSVTLSGGTTVDLPLQPAYELCADLVVNDCPRFINATWARLRSPPIAALSPNCSATVTLGAALNPAYPDANSTSLWDFGALGTAFVAPDAPGARSQISDIRV